MRKTDKEVVASFTVETDNFEQKQIVICQGITDYYKKEEKYSKCFRLGSPSGIAVYQTENPNVFQTADGIQLKRKKG